MGDTSADLLVDVYFRNVGKRALHLCRPRADAFRSNEPVDPHIGIRFTVPSGETYTGPAFSPPAQLKPSLMTIAPGETFKESGGVVMPGVKPHGWPKHLIQPHKVRPAQPTTEAVGALRFVYQSDTKVRDCFNPGLGEMILHVNDMWTGSAESGVAFVFLRMRNEYNEPESVPNSRRVLDQ